MRFINLLVNKFLPRHFHLCWGNALKTLYAALRCLAAKIMKKLQHIDPILEISIPLEIST